MILTIYKDEVFKEVAMTAEYVGAKSTDLASYESVSVSKANQDILDKFWNDASSGATEKFKRFVSEVKTSDGKYEANLFTGNRFNDELVASIRESLKSYFVSMIVCKWLELCNNEKSSTYANDAVAAMDDVMRKLYNRPAPKRVVPST